MGIIEPSKTASVIIVPHRDDEWFCTASLLLNYPKTIFLYITHPSDCISKEAFVKQTTMFEQALRMANIYRSKNNMQEIIPYTNLNSNFNGVMDNEDRKKLQSEIENRLKWLEKIDYFVTTVKSTHQSHQECNNIAMSMLRSPFIEKMQNVLYASYPQAYFSVPYDEGSGSFNTYVEMNDEQIEITRKVIGEVYGEKNHPNTILGADNFVEALRFFGLASGRKYSQPFITKRRNASMYYLRDWDTIKQ